MNKINFIFWKNIWTKRLQSDNIITCHFEVSKKMWKDMSEQINKVMILIVEHNWVKEEYDCYINDDGGIPIWFKDDHGILKLDIKIINRLLIWYIIDSNLFLKY